ncbi:galactofuranose ABC transporter, permease protein YjfF [Horticoccus sp. 23ND18S-11]|uniref:galactofuranose ABC transporter, permease protein YjfF n=1 Tax=Horticoccus sp. 23ND18S-11 TaxID=3391832 RepID=UPI0039C95C2F
MSALASVVRRNLPLGVTGLILVVLFGAASLAYDGFFSPRVMVNLFADNAFLGIAAVGMTLVIFSGGIDLSVGAVIGFTSIFTATLISGHGVTPVVAWTGAVGLGGLLGAAMGALIHVFRLPAFLVTLAGMFLSRGAGFWLNTESVGITHPWYEAIANFSLSLGERIQIPAAALLLLGFVAVGYVVAHHRRFGRTLLAIGGNEQSAILMGLPVGRTKIAVYTLNGMGAAAAGIVATLYTGSGNPSMGTGLELDAIAVVVMGGTLLAGGRGHLLGTLLGVLIFGTIQAAILFDGRLSSWWMRIVVGALLLGFILLQRFLVRGAGRRA